MKKVMVGILILIPVIILVIIIAVSNFLQMTAWIAVDDFDVLDKAGEEAESLTVVFPGESTAYKMYDYLDIKVKPDYANRYSVEWRISGEVECMDSEYEKKYNKYIEERNAHDKYVSDVGAITEQIRVIYSEIDVLKEALDKRIEEINEGDEFTFEYEKDEAIEEATQEFNAQKAEKQARINALNAQKDSIVEPEVGRKVDPAAMFVDDNGNEVTSNTTGKFVVNSYCRFNVIIQVEDVNKTLTVIAEGYNVESIQLARVGEGTSTVKAGEKILLEPTYQPLSSIVTKTRWHSSDPTVASVDGNGVVTAHKAGSADITLEANKFDVDEYVTSAVYTVTVEKGASKYGNNITTSKTNLTLDELGIVAPVSYEGCEINGNGITLTADVAQITTADGTVTMTRCNENDIVIENAEIYGAENGYVFAVGGLPLNLKARWKDDLKEGAPEVVWTAHSAGNIATVAQNGEVTASDSGLVEITADKDGKVAKIIINMQLKLVSMKLRTGNDYYSVGLALETVFASERYVNAQIDLISRRTNNQTPDKVISNDKEPNSTLIQIIGAPKRAQDDTDSVYEAKLLAFYDAFTYEIISGEEYAHFDATTPNKLVFDSALLEGKGKQIVKVKVRAKYPRYANASKLIEEEVDIKVIYGVEVSNMQEIRVATHDQYEYAYKEGNLVDREKVFEHTVTEDHAPEIYRVYNGDYSKYTYAISVVSDLSFEEGPVNDVNALKVFGDVYGNGHRLQAERNQLDGNQAMVWIGWSNVTVSNFNLRANRLDKDGTLSVDETMGLTGEGFQIFSVSGWELWVQGYTADKPYARPDHYYGHTRNRLFNVRYEYSIVENGHRIGQAYNADYTLDGLVMRNVIVPGLYNVSRMYMYYEENEGYITYPDYTHTVINNCVFSNCLATVGSFSQESFTVLSPKGNGWNNDYHGNDGSEMGDGRFVRKDPARNAEYFLEHFASKGINCEVEQTGFVDIYNWQDVKNAKLIEVGDNDQGLGDILISISGKLIAVNPEFARCLYFDEAENIRYFHMGFLFSGMDFSAALLNEPLYIKSSFADPRFAETIKSTDITETPGAEPLVQVAERTIHGLSVHVVSYTSDMTKNDISPYSTFEINESFIRRLHQSA